MRQFLFLVLLLSSRFCLFRLYVNRVTGKLHVLNVCNIVTVLLLALLLVIMRYIIVCINACTSAGSDVLRALYSELTTMLDARILAANMYQRNALTLKELQSIQSLRSRSVEAAETLLSIIMEQPDAVYLCFLDVLKHTEQLHIYQRLVEDGYKGRWYRPLCHYRQINFNMAFKLL